jgi:ABC-2 type transport system permease protein
MMKTKQLFESITMAWAIAWKDIVDVSKNKSTRVNLLVVIALIFFFYWLSTPRPFDKKIDVVYYDQGQSSIEDLPTDLTDGYSFRFLEADSLGELKRNMGYKELGIEIPQDFEVALAEGHELELNGYLMWIYRGRAAELEDLYSQKFTELLGSPVRVLIGDNFVIPEPDVNFSAENVNIFLIIFLMALTLVPNLMLEEKQNKTLDALMVSPASAGQVVLGKALAGFFYILLSGGLFFVLHVTYIKDWALALLAFLLMGSFSIGFALVLGSITKRPQQLSLWRLPIVVLLILPAVFAREPLLAPGLMKVLSWVPSTALVDIMQLSFSTHAPWDMLGKDLVVSLASIVILYGIVIWLVRRSDK